MTDWSRANGTSSQPMLRTASLWAKDGDDIGSKEGSFRGGVKNRIRSPYSGFLPRRLLGG